MGACNRKSPSSFLVEHYRPQQTKASSCVVDTVPNKAPPRRFRYVFAPTTFLQQEFIDIDRNSVTFYSLRDFKTLFFLPCVVESLV